MRRGTPRSKPTPPDKRSEWKGNHYARFDDRSYGRLYLQWEHRGEIHYCDKPLFQIADTARSKGHWDRLVEEFHVYCDEYGKEVEADYKGRSMDKDTFQIGDVSVIVCADCQRRLVVRALVGE